MPQKTKYQRISSIKTLKKLCYNHWLEAVIALDFGLISRKNIIWLPKNRKFAVFNFIDNTTQKLTEKKLNDKRYTNIGYAIRKKCLFYAKNV